MIEPFYKDESVTIFHGDSREIMPTLSGIGLVLTDPPYGISHPTDYAARGRGKLAGCSDYIPVYGDNEPFDPAAILALEVPTILWGANYFADKLPISSGWLVWDKERPDDLDQSTCELAWTNFVKGVRRFRFMWNGMLRSGSEALYHPTQKPIALSKWVLSLKWAQELRGGGITRSVHGSGRDSQSSKGSGSHSDRNRDRRALLRNCCSAHVAGGLSL